MCDSGTSRPHVSLSLSELANRCHNNRIFGHLSMAKICCSEHLNLVPLATRPLLAFLILLAKCLKVNSIDVCCVLQDSSILHASWPVASNVNEKILRSSQYLMDCAREFRLRLKNMITVAEKSKKVSYSK